MLSPEEKFDNQIHIDRDLERPSSSSTTDTNLHFIATPSSPACSSSRSWHVHLHTSLLAPCLRCLPRHQQHELHTLKLPHSCFPTLKTVQYCIHHGRITLYYINTFFKMSGASTWLQRMRKSELIELCDSVGYSEYAHSQCITPRQLN